MTLPSGSDQVVTWMRNLAIPVTRENFIEFNWLGNPPEPWTAEDEMQLPIYLQSSEYAGFGSDAWNEADHPRGQPENAGEFAKSPGGGSAPNTEHNSAGGEKANGGSGEHKPSPSGEHQHQAANPQKSEAAPEHGKLETGKPLPHDVAARLASAAAAAQAIPPTHTINTPERAALRTKITDDLYNKDIAKRAHNHEATIILGLPGAGKSTFANPLLNAGAIEIDPDLAKEKLPEFNHGLGAMATHEESSQITRDVLKKALSNGDNIVWPRINSPEKIVNDIKSLKTAGYKVHVRFVDVDHDTAVNSVINRFLQTGRMVPPSVIDAYGDKAAQAYEIARKSGLIESAERHKRGAVGGFTKVEEDKL